MSTSSTACGEPCRKLNVEQHAFHLLRLEGEHTDIECYRLAGYETKSKGSRAANASRLLSSEKMQKALSFHLDRRAAKTSKKRDRAIERLTARTESNLSDFVEVRLVEVTAARLIEISELPEDEMQAEIRNLQQVRVIPWDEIDRDKLAVLLEVAQTADGAIRYKLEPRSPAENLLAEMGGWKAPTEVKVLRGIEAGLQADQGVMLEVAAEMADGDGRVDLAAVLEEAAKRTASG